MNLGVVLKDQDPIVYQGKTFPKTGSRSPQFPQYVALVSQDGAFLAVNSWDGVIAIPEPFMGGRRQYDGNYYVDIYDVASEHRLLAIQGEFHGVAPHDFFEKSAWISKRLFVLPLDDNQPPRRFVICDVQRVRGASDSR